MPDITMCKGDRCLLKDNCRRFKAEPNERRQSYFANPPFKVSDNVMSCEMYWGETSDYVFSFLKKITNGSNDI